jgi:hypothetical protein
VVAVRFTTSFRITVDTFGTQYHACHPDARERRRICSCPLAHLATSQSFHRPDHRRSGKSHLPEAAEKDSPVCKSHLPDGAEEDSPG